MRHGHHECCVGFQHTVDLTQQSSHVVDIRQRVARDHQVHRRAGDEPQVGNLGLVTLHRDLSGLGLAAQQGNAIRRGVHRQRTSTGRRQGHGVARGTDAQLDDPLAGDIAQQPKLALVGHR